MSSTERSSAGRVLLAALAALLLVGCFPRARTGWFDDSAFYVSRQHYRVRYLADGAAQRRLLPAGWRLDNFQLDAQGRPAEALRGWDHDRVLTFDRNGDGRIDVRTREPRYELHFQHLEHDAVIWANTLPLDRISSERSLEAFLRIVVEAFAEESHRVGKGELARAGRRGVRIVEEGPATLQSSSASLVPARGVVFELLDLDAPRGSEVLGLVEILVARPTDTWSAGGGPGVMGEPPMVVFFGYAARVDVFEAHRVDFAAMLDRVDFRR